MNKGMILCLMAIFFAACEQNDWDQSISMSGSERAAENDIAVSDGAISATGAQMGVADRLEESENMAIAETDPEFSDNEFYDEVDPDHSELLDGTQTRAVEYDYDIRLKKRTPKLYLLNTSQNPDKGYHMEVYGNRFQVVETGVGYPFRIYPNGNVIINGGLSIQSNNGDVGGNTRLRLKESYGNDSIWELRAEDYVSGGNANFFSIYGGQNSDLARRLVITKSGDVGIGTETPEHRLEVNGTVRAKKVIVETNWSDFVFEKDYDLKSLEEVRAYINKNGHLPDVPSAKKVEKEGISLGESQAKLLQKIEELTLYAIAQNDRIKKLESETCR